MFRQACAPVTIRAADRALGSPALQVDSPWIGIRLCRLELPLLSEAVLLLAEDEALIGITEHLYNAVTALVDTAPQGP